MGLLSKIEDRKAVVSVVGLGYAGLPLAIAFAEAGFRVVGIDVDEAKVDSINRGESYFDDVPTRSLAAVVGSPVSSDIGGARASSLDVNGGPRLSATTDFDSLNSADAVIICVPTPLSKIKDPDLSYVITAAREISSRLHEGVLVVLESTTYAGTTEEVILPILRDDNGKSLEVGRDFFLAYSPERVDPGRKDWTVKTTPKIIGGVTEACLEVAKKLYGCAIDELVPVSSPKVAEMVKLLENTFRATNVALVNEIAIMCDRLGIDVWEVIDAAKTKPFGFMSFYPGPGLGGHCVPIDPQYLAWKLKTLNYNARFIQLAAEINLSMPGYVLGKISDLLNESRKPLRGSRILVLGVAYKADVSDFRESPALDLIDLLQGKGAEVAYNDPHVPQIEVGDSVMANTTLDEEALRNADCVVIATEHSSYDWQWVVDNSHLIVDTRNATRHSITDKQRVSKL